jgi:hypothetical protein
MHRVMSVLIFFFILQNLLSFTTSQLKIVVGQVSLTAVDPGEETIGVITNHFHEFYDAIGMRNNIAMLQVLCSKIVSL